MEHDYPAPDPVTRAVQLKELELLDIFGSFCADSGISYFFCGGALIGAVRHKGFIPWDDDIDVYVKRDEYERIPALFSEWNTDPRYSMEKTTPAKFADTMLTQLSDSSTTFIKSSQASSDVNHGVRLEIIPLDAARTGFFRKTQIAWAAAFALFNRRWVPKNQGRAAAALARLLLGIFRSDKSRTAMWRLCERRMAAKRITPSTRFLTELTVDFKYVKNLYPREIFDSAVMLDFEGRKIPAPAGWREYLTIAFGDFMTPPPPDKRTGHDPAFVDLDNSYLTYRGVHYGVPENRPQN